MKRLAALGLAGLSALSALPAHAQFKDADGNIHFQDGISANQLVEVSAGQLERSIRADYCGIVTVGIPTNGTMPSSVNVDGSAIDIASLPTQARPSCKDNQLAEARPANFKDSSGRVFVVNKTPGISYDVVYPGVPSVKSYRANACGLARISNSTANPAPPTFTYNGTNYTTASLPTQNPARCIQGVKYVPQP